MNKEESVSIFLIKELEGQAAKLEICKELLEKTFPKDMKTTVVGTVLAIRADSAISSLKKAIDALDFAYSMILSINKDAGLVN
jgi:hypothetical protein